MSHRHSFMLLAFALMALLHAPHGSMAQDTGLTLPDPTAPQYQPKIIGGKPAAAGQFPWAVSVQKSIYADPLWGHDCGGSVYAEQWIITAAHCVTGKPSSAIKVIAGEVKLLAGTVRRDVANIYIHPEFLQQKVDGFSIQHNDIALLYLRDKLPLGNAVSTIALIDTEAEHRLMPSGTMLITMGWGITAVAGLPVREINFVEVPLHDRGWCNRPFGYDRNISDRMLCAGSKKADACQKDSGGPLILERQGAPALLVGIVSWAYGCASENRPGVFARISSYKEWVEQCVRKPEECPVKKSGT